MKALSRPFILAAPAVLGALSAFATATPPQTTSWAWTLPSFLPPPRVPDDNPMSEAKFELGRALFYDKRLSGNGTLACGSCHLQERGFTDGRNLSVGSTGQLTPRNAQGLANVAWHATYTWANPALVTLERQMEVPFFGTDPIEMGVTDANKPEILARLAADPFYAKSFAEAFPEASNPLTFASVIKAIATFERGMVAAKSRYDLYLEGKVKFTEAEQRGHDLFFGEKAECHHCHGSSNFDDQFVHAKSREVETPFHNTGLYDIDRKGAYPRPNRGLLETSGEPSDMGRFRAPSLRNVAVTAPYMHDGSVATLEEVVEIYSRGGRSIETGPLAGDGRLNPHKSDLIVPIDLTKREKADLVAFLETLTDETFLHAPGLSDPWTNPGGLAQGRGPLPATP
jgi:cytochrome c peroxidase